MFFENGTTGELDLGASHVTWTDRLFATGTIFIEYFSLSSRFSRLKTRVGVSSWIGRGNTRVRKRRWKQRRLGMLTDTLGGPGVGLGDQAWTGDVSDRRGFIGPSDFDLMPKYVFDVISKNEAPRHFNIGPC